MHENYRYERSYRRLARTYKDPHDLLQAVQKPQVFW